MNDMETLFTHLARRQLAALDTSLAVGRAGLASFGRLTELNLAVARAAVDDASLVALRLVAAQTPGEAAAELNAGLPPQVERFALYCAACREIGRGLNRSLAAALPAEEPPAK